MQLASDLDVGKLPSAGWTMQDLNEIFAVTRWWLTENQMFVMVGVAVSVSFAITIIIVNLFDRSKDDEKDYDYEEM